MCSPTAKIRRWYEISAHCFQQMERRRHKTRRPKHWIQRQRQSECRKEYFTLVACSLRTDHSSAWSADIITDQEHTPKLGLGVREPSGPCVILIDPMVSLTPGKDVSPKMLHGDHRINENNLNLLEKNPYLQGMIRQMPAMISHCSEVY